MYEMDGGHTMGELVGFTADSPFSNTFPNHFFPQHLNLKA